MTYSQMPTFPISCLPVHAFPGIVILWNSLAYGKEIILPTTGNELKYFHFTSLSLKKPKWTPRPRMIGIIWDFQRKRFVWSSLKETFWLNSTTLFEFELVAVAGTRETIAPRFRAQEGTIFFYGGILFFSSYPSFSRSVDQCYSST